MGEIFTATLQRDGQVVASGLQVRLRIITARNGLVRGEGSFSPPSGVAVAVGAEYDLLAEDGRSGRIMTNRMLTGSSQQTEVQFVTQGRFG